MELPDATDFNTLVGLIVGVFSESVRFLYNTYNYNLLHTNLFSATGEVALKEDSPHRRHMQLALLILLCLAKSALVTLQQIVIIMCLSMDTVTAYC